MSAELRVAGQLVEESAPRHIICHECGLAHKRRSLPRDTSAVCSRCGCVLQRQRPATHDHALALTIAGLVLFLVANLLPFLSFRMGVQTTQTTLVSGALELYRQGREGLAAIVTLTSILAPGLQIVGLLYTLVPLHTGRTPPHLGRVFRYVSQIIPWSMMDVFMLGILVAVVKLAAMATIVPGPALGAFMLLIVVLAWAQSKVDTDRIWAQVRVAPILPANQGGVVECLICHLEAPITMQRCPRCAAALHHRKPESLQRTWALLLAAGIAYVPANLLPVMHVVSLGNTQSDTILSGAIYLLVHGQWPLALIIVIASILVPLLKMIILGLLLITVQRGSRWRQADRTRLYRLTEVVGRWSMVDVFCVTVLVALVKLGNLATIEAGLGAVFFCAVVILTILAAMSFDPRLIWDPSEPAHGR